ncbi:MAG: hypothetical protein IMZ44_00615 [Planctomycetes bacterium]|nr:hypothetical protein [Planctomycetota bacterium]
MPLLALAVLVLVISIDEPPPADGDLRVVRLQIPDDQNALTYFQQAIDKLDLPKDDEPAMESPAPPPKVKPLPGEEPDPNEPRPTRKQRWHALTRGDVEWDQPIADEVLKRNAGALALWERGIDAPHYQAPLASPYSSNQKEVPLHWWSYHNLANVVGVASRDRARRGDHEGAFEDALNLVRFGQQVESGEYLVSLTIKGMGTCLMCDQVKTCTLPSSRLRHYAAELAKYPCEAQALADAFRVEYFCQVSGIEDVRSGEVSWAYSNALWPAGPQQGPTGPTVRFLWRALGGPLFKPNRTRRLFAETMRMAIEDAPKSYKDARATDPRMRAFSLPKSVLQGNVIGDALYRLLMPELRGAHKFKCVANVGLAATRTLLAMKAYKLDKGRLPETLEQLVPDYLDAVPIDDFDGKPLRYNAAKKILYTVGKDLEDNGGTTKQEFIDARIRELHFDPNDVQPDQLSDFEAGYPWEAPDPAFAIEF